MFKLELILVPSSMQPAVNCPDIVVGDESISSSSSVQNLGISMDTNRAEYNKSSSEGGTSGLWETANEAEEEGCSF